MSCTTMPLSGHGRRRVVSAFTPSMGNSESSRRDCPEVRREGTKAGPEGAGVADASSLSAGHDPASGTSAPRLPSGVPLAITARIPSVPRRPNAGREFSLDIILVRSCPPSLRASWTRSATVEEDHGDDQRRADGKGSREGALTGAWGLRVTVDCAGRRHTSRGDGRESGLGLAAGTVRPTASSRLAVVDSTLETCGWAKRRSMVYLAEAASSLSIGSLCGVGFAWWPLQSTGSGIPSNLTFSSLRRPATVVLMQVLEDDGNHRRTAAWCPT